MKNVNLFLRYFVYLISIINIRINTDLNSKNNDVENIKNSENDKRMNQIEKKDKEKNERNKKAVMLPRWWTV